MHQTKNDLPEETRAAVIELLNNRLADVIDLKTQLKQAHWNIKGMSFSGLHELFDEAASGADEYADLIAERVVQLGGIAEGTARMVAGRTSLDEYPLEAVSGRFHAEAVSSALARFGAETRTAISEADSYGDAVTADILTEISRGADKHLWFVEAHLQAAEKEIAVAGGAAFR